MELRGAGEGVYVLHLGSGENRLSRAFCTAFLDILDGLDRRNRDAHAESTERCHCLITVGQGRHYCNGLDLQTLREEGRPHDFMSAYVLPLYQRLLSADYATVAAINGHAYAGGLVLALAHDFRLMRGDRGFACMNEVLLPGPIPQGMLAVLQVVHMRAPIIPRT
jgi:enoyl-CoA hydratase/carnithine racemase